MVAASKTISLLAAPRGNALIASADVPPGWQASWVTIIPFFGQIFNILGNSAKYFTTLEDCADFMAADLTNPDSGFVGHRVGVLNKAKAKSE